MRKKSKKRLDKLKKQGYDIFSISEYAKKMYIDEKYNKTWTEYRTQKILRESE